MGFILALACIGLGAILGMGAMGAWSPPLSPDARAALDDAGLAGAAIDVASTGLGSLDVFTTLDVPLHPPSLNEIRPALAASHASIQANADYAAALKKIAANGDFTAGEQAALKEARLRAEAAAAAEYKAWQATPAGDLIEVQSEMIACVAGAMADDDDDDDDKAAKP